MITLSVTCPEGNEGPDLVLVGLIGKANGGLLEERHEFRTRSLQLNHPHSLNLFRAPAIDRAFQSADEKLVRR